MDTLWFILAVVFFVLWLGKRPKGIEQLTAEMYNRGFHDGLQARNQSAQSTKTPTSSVYPTPKPHAQIATPSVSAAVTVHQSPQQTVSVPYTPAQKPETPEEKAKRDLQNINTALYAASFLLVGAAVLFVGAALPDAVKFIAVWLVTLGFYGTGLILHRFVEKLRPAAIAFVGTGLAILPFTGIAMYNFILHDAPTSWFLTSLIGLVAFIYGAVSLKNQVIAYLAIAFAGSLAISSVSLAHTGLMPYFISLILFGSVMTLLARLRPKWVPECFTKPIQTSNQWIIPLTIGASLLSFSGLTVQDYWVLALVASIYYGAVAASAIDKHEREISIFVTRLLLSLSALLMAYDFSNSSWVVVGWVLTFVSVIQMLISAIFLPKRIAGDQNNEVWLWLGLSGQLFAPMLMLSDVNWPTYVLWQLIILLIASLVTTFYLRRLVVSTFGTISAAFMPIVWGIYVVKPSLESHWIAFAFLMMAVTMAGLRLAHKLSKLSEALRPYLVGNLALFMIESLLFTGNVSNEWGVGIWFTAAILVYGLMYLEKQPWLSILSNFMILIAVIRFIEPNVEPQWISLVYLFPAAMTISVLAMKDYLKLSTLSQQVRMLNFALFLMESLYYTTNVTAGWGFAIWAVGTLMVFALMFIEKLPWLSLIANVMILVNVFRFVLPNVDQQWVSLSLLGLSLISLVTIGLKKSIKISEAAYQYWIINFTIYLIEALYFTFGLSIGWSFAIWAAATLMIYSFVYLEKKPAISLAANGTLIVSTYKLLELVGANMQWRFMIISWIIFGIFYSVNWLLELLEKKDYAVYFWWSAVVSTGLISFYHLSLPIDKSIAVWACMTFAVVAFVVAIEGWLIKKLEYVDVGAIMATVGLQRLLYLYLDVNILVYTHWWSLVLGTMAYMHYKFGNRKDAKSLGYIALSVMTFFSGLAALGYFGPSDVPYQVVFIVEHVALLIAGVMANRKVITSWGAVAAILAVLWMIKDLTWLLLTVAALALIAFAIYALFKQSKKTA